MAPGRRPASVLACAEAGATDPGLDMLSPGGGRDERRRQGGLRLLINRIWCARFAHVSSLASPNPGRRLLRLLRQDAAQVAETTTFWIWGYFLISCHLG